MQIRTRFGCFFLTFLLGCISLTVQAKPTDRAYTKLPVTQLTVTPLVMPKSLATTLRVMTLNTAHGARNRMGIVPFLRSAKVIRKRLTEVAAVIRREHPHVVAFQEIDAPSWWSGRFHHGDFIARRAGFPYSMLGIHVKTARKAYGTGIITVPPPQHSYSYKFKRSGMFQKGFVVTSVPWPGRPKFLIDIVSVHFHPSNKSIQRSQVDEMAAALKHRKHPLVLMGDFNCEWYPKKSALRYLVRRMGLKTYKPYNPYLNTHFFPRKRRIDWIFLSQRLGFRNYRVLKDQISDHAGIVADLYDTLAPVLPPKPSPTTRMVPPRQHTTSKATTQSTTAPSSRPASRPTK